MWLFLSSLAQDFIEEEVVKKDDVYYLLIPEFSSSGLH